MRDFLQDDSRFSCAHLLLHKAQSSFCVLNMLTNVVREFGQNNLFDLNTVQKTLNEP